MSDESEFAYIPDSYLCLILKTAINNAWTDTDDWSLAMIGHLLHNCNMVSVFDFDGINCINFDFIETDYQWLYVYQLFVQAYQVILKLPPIINGDSLKIINEERITDYPTDSLKKYTKLFLEEFVKIATFPNLENEWLNLFKYLRENKLFWGELSHPTAKQIIYNTEDHKLLDELGNQIKWFDILSLYISPKTPINKFKLNAKKHDLFYSITSVENSNWNCTYSLGGYDVSKVNQSL